VSLRCRCCVRAGKPVASIPGAARLGNHDLLTRHQEVIGPKVTALVEKMAPGAIHDLLAGFGKGATEAPCASYRLESASPTCSTRGSPEKNATGNGCLCLGANPNPELA
jgi:hypothetical protein